MTTILTTRPQRRRLQEAVALLGRRRHLTRRDLQIALGVLWLLDGGLQAQPFMFTRGFATQLIAPTGQSQPSVVSDPVHLASTVIAKHAAKVATSKPQVAAVVARSCCCKPG